MNKAKLLIPMALLLFGFGPCNKDGPEVVQVADQKAKASDLPAARDEYAKIIQGNPDSIYAGLGAAYSDLLVGDYAAADTKLAKAEEKAEEPLKGEIRIRRAMVAMRAGNLDSVKKHGKASGLPVGKLLAAEVHLADLEEDEAIILLAEAAQGSGVVAQTAQHYLEMVQSDDQIKVGLAEASALWALGQREAAVEAAEELVKNIPGDDEKKAEQLLLWASRAVTSKRPEIASSLLDEIDFPPEGQAWRVQATRAMVALAQGDDQQGLRIFQALADGGAPADGLADALATAASLAQDKAVAKQLASSVESSASAMGLYKAGATVAARKSAPAGSFSTFLESQ